MKNFKKFLSLVSLFLISISSVYADTMTANTEIAAIDTPVNNIFKIVKNIALVGIILGIMICAICWAVPYLTKKERSGQNEELMQLLIKIGVACIIISGCVFLPITIYNAIAGAQNTITNSSDFILSI